ncbi:MAG: hypothetical protein V4755_06160 [Curtobacterium sp.]
MTTWMTRTRWRMPAFAQLAVAVVLLLAFGGLAIWGGTASITAALFVGMLGVVIAGYLIVDGVNTIERSDRQQARDADAEAIASAIHKRG